MPDFHDPQGDRGALLPRTGEEIAMDEPKTEAPRPGVYGMLWYTDAPRAQDRQARFERLREALFLMMVRYKPNEAVRGLAVGADFLAHHALAEWDRLDAEAAERKVKP